MQYYIIDSLKILVKISKCSQDQYRYKYISPMAYAKEICTINCCSSRCSGHSTALLKLKSSFGLKPLYFFRTKENAMFFQDYILKDEYITYDDKYRLQNKLIGIRNLPRIDCVAVDNSHFLSNKRKELIYQTFCEQTLKKNYFFFIFLQ